MFEHEGKDFSDLIIINIKKISNLVEVDFTYMVQTVQGPNDDEVNVVRNFSEHNEYTLFLSFKER